MRVVVDARTAIPHFPGIGRYVSNLLESMARLEEDLSLHIIKPPPSRGSFVLPDLPATLVPDSAFSFRQQLVLPRIVRNIKPSLYHSPYYMMPYRMPVPVVLTCYDLIPMIYRQYFSVFQRTAFVIAHRFALRTASHIIAISEATKSDLVRYFSVEPERVTAIPLAADTAFSPVKGKDIAIMRNKYGIPDRYVLYVGINKPHKNLLMLLKAWGILMCNGQTEGHSLVIAGYWDPRYPDAKRYVINNGLDKTVHIIGDVQEHDLPSLYSGATAFIYPSLYEGFGLPLLEAMACGTPVMCGNVSSLPEVTGEAAAYFDPVNAGEIADTMGEVLASRKNREVLQEKGFARARLFLWEQTALRTVQVYKKVAEQGQSE